MPKNESLSDRLRDKVAAGERLTVEDWRDRNLAMKFKARCFKAVCKQCGDIFHGVEWKDKNGMIADTWRYMDFDRVVCDACAKSPMNDRTHPGDPCCVCGEPTGDMKLSPDYV